MKARKTLATTVAAVSLAGSMAMLTACGDDGSKSLSAADAAALCAQLTIDALNLSQKFTVAAFAHKPTDAELKELDTQMAALRDQQKKLTVEQRAALSAMLEASATARHSMADGKSVDAASVSLAQQNFAKTCLPG